MIKYKFACFILCHGRPDNVPTYSTLLKRGYTGDIYIICDDEDKTLDGYIERFGDKVKVFSKDAISREFDTMDTSENRACAVYARNACWSIAKELGLDYYVQLDDDYSDIAIRVPEGEKLPLINHKNLDSIFNLYIEFLTSSENIYSVAFAQNGDYIGGAGCQLISRGYKRKCMNSWICKVHTPFKFNGRMNDDVNTYCLGGSRGEVFMTFPWVSVNQPETQSVEGGMTEMYSGEGTYIKSFFTVLCCPSFVKVYVVGRKNFRIHHLVQWEHACPKIISGRYKK